MAPKKAPTPALTKAEQLLLLVAARINTGVRYLEAHGGADNEHLRKCLDEEVVSRSVYNVYSQLTLRHNS